MSFCHSDIPWLAVSLATLSKLCVSTSFDVMFVFAGELFPTVMRGIAYGVGSTMSQIGLVLTPYILFMVSKLRDVMLSSKFVTSYYPFSYKNLWMISDNFGDSFVFRVLSMVG